MLALDTANGSSATVLLPQGLLVANAKGERKYATVHVVLVYMLFYYTCCFSVHAVVLLHMLF